MWNWGVPLKIFGGGGYMASVRVPMYEAGNQIMFKVRSSRTDLQILTGCVGLSLGRCLAELSEFRRSRVRCGVEPPRGT